MQSTQSRVPDPKPTENTGGKKKIFVKVNELWSRLNASAQYLQKLRTLLIPVRYL